MSESLIFFERIAHFCTKNERFARKSNERIPSTGKMRPGNFKFKFINMKTKTEGLLNPFQYSILLKSNELSNWRIVLKKTSGR